jgi:hypothetical protein
MHEQIENIVTQRYHHYLNPIFFLVQHNESPEHKGRG